MRSGSLDAASNARKRKPAAQSEYTSRWSSDELALIQKVYPQFKENWIKPSLDQIIVEFLERYEVYVQPASSAQGRSAGDRLSDGMVGGLAGPAAVAANQGLRGQQKNTAVQEWTQWKQWALDHKAFEAFRADKSASYDTLKKRLESEEFATEWNCNKDIFLARLREKEKEATADRTDVLNKLMILTFGTALALALIGVIVEGVRNGDSNKRRSSLNGTTALTAS